MYSAQDLAQEFDFTAGAIYVLVSRGILPKARGRGPGKHYGAEHYRALREYRKLIPFRENRIRRIDIAEDRRNPA